MNQVDPLRTMGWLNEQHQEKPGESQFFNNLLMRRIETRRKRRNGEHRTRSGAGNGKLGRETLMPQEATQFVDGWNRHRHRHNRQDAQIDKERNTDDNK